MSEPLKKVGDTLKLIVLIQDRKDALGRIWAVSIAFVLACIVGFAHGSEPNSNSYSPVLASVWLLCAVASIGSAAILSSWIAYRCLFLLPIAMGVFTTVFAVISFEVAERGGHKLDPYTGIDAIGLAVVAFLAGFPLMAVFAYIRYLYR